MARQRWYSAHWFVESLGIWENASERATSYAEAIEKLNRQWKADIKLDPRRPRNGKGRYIWSGGRRGDIECR